MAKYGLNRVELIGNLGKDPELKYLDQGIALATIRIACTERGRNKDGEYIDRTEWVTVNLWRSQAEIVAKYCKKGSTVFIEGRLRNQNWETPEGERRSRLDIDASRVILLDGRPTNFQDLVSPPSSVPASDTPSHFSDSMANKAMTNQQIINQEEKDDDDLPF